MKTRLITKQTKREKEKAKILSKLIEHLYFKEDWEYQRKIMKLAEIARERNPLGLISVKWSKHENT